MLHLTKCSMLGAKSDILDIKNVIKITFTITNICLNMWDIYESYLLVTFTIWYYEAMTVDELFDAIEEQITKDAYVYTDLWKAYITIGTFHKNLVFPPHNVSPL